MKQQFVVIESELLPADCGDLLFYFLHNFQKMVFYRFYAAQIENTDFKNRYETVACLNRHFKKVSIMNLEFTKDVKGSEVLLKEGKHQVMMEWEKPYMEACIDALKPFGDVLEIGFGLGYSASRIQHYRPKSHTIIECDPEVAERGRQFARKHPDVKIIEDTWQNALSSLGIFDVVFFDDYPLQTSEQMETLKSEASQSNIILESGKKTVQTAMQSVGTSLPKHYSNDDLVEFFSVMTSSSTDPRHLLFFLLELEQRQQITTQQHQDAIQLLLKKNLISQADLATFSPPAKPIGSFDFEEKGDRLFEFLSLILKNHTRKGSRFSCFIEDPTSKFEDKKFFEHIITNPYLNYVEKWIDIEVPTHCKYYKGNKALIITVEVF